jgi:hypothetical protein
MAIMSKDAIALLLNPTQNLMDLTQAQISE